PRARHGRERTRASVANRCRCGRPGRGDPVNIREGRGEHRGGPVEIGHFSAGRLRPGGDGLWPCPVGSRRTDPRPGNQNLAAWSAIAPREGSADLTVTTAPDARPEWSAADKRAIDLIRVLAMDAVQQAGSGHPGTAMSLAPAAYLLFQQILRHDPADPSWLGRDRFVLSCGHSSLTLYLQLYLSGYGLTLDDIRHYRTWGSLTPGHPEHGLTPGVETTTRPLGQGVANAVGMAMAARPPPPRRPPPPPAAGGGCSTRTRPRARAPSTTTCTPSSRTATSRKASATRARPWPPTSGSAT